MPAEAVCQLRMRLPEEIEVEDTSEDAIDRDVQEALRFQRYMLG